MRVSVLSQKPRRHIGMVRALNPLSARRCAEDKQAKSLDGAKRVDGENTHEPLESNLPEADPPSVENLKNSFSKVLGYR